MHPLGYRDDIQIFVEDLVLAETNQYVDQYLRPYITQLDGSTIDAIESRQNVSRRFTPEILAGIANQFIIPDYKTRGVIEIPNGWSSRRGRFILTVGFELSIGSRLRQVIIGYTDTPGFSSRSIDHEMEFFINNTYLLKEQTVWTDRGNEKIWHPTNISDVMSDRFGAGIRGRSNLYTIRPMDIYNVLDADDSTKILKEVEEVIDERIWLSKNSIKSSVDNRLPSRFMSKVLKSRQQARDNTQFNNSAADINATAQHYAMESYASDDLFMSKLMQIQGHRSVTDRFTFRDLLEIDPDIERKKTIYLLGPNATDYYDYSNRLNGQEESDRIASLIAMAVPAIMMELGLSRVKFQCHNNRPSKDFNFTIMDGRSLVKGMEMDYFLDSFKDRIVYELMKPISANDMITVGIEVSCDVFGDIDFKLFWDGIHRGLFVLPCFCNSLGTPVVTDTVEDVYKISRDFGDLMDHFLPIIGSNPTTLKDNLRY